MAKIEILTRAIQLAMSELENMPMGNIGDGGPTLAELTRHVDDTGSVWENDAAYHTAQTAWRMLSEAIEDVRCGSDDGNSDGD